MPPCVVYSYCITSVWLGSRARSLYSVVVLQLLVSMSTSLVAPDTIPRTAANRLAFRGRHQNLKGGKCRE